jgi:uncharacterized OB-fold protein
MPVVDDPDTAGFWEAARRGSLALQFCAACDEPIHLPRPRCPSCGSVDSTWLDVASYGEVYSWTVVRHQIHPGFPAPYTLVLVQLRDFPSVRLIGHLEGEPPLTKGQPVRARFGDRGSDVVIPQWETIGYNEGDAR